MKKPPINFLD